MYTTKWTTEENRLIRQFYSCGYIDELHIKLEHRTKNAIAQQANKLGFFRERRDNSAKLDVLLEDTIETYYWIGFLLADGHFTESGRLHLQLAAFDGGHLQSFVDYIKMKSPIATTVKNQKSIAVSDKYLISQIAKKFDISHQKTYNPPNIKFYDNLSNDLFLALLIGFIDGDGTIRVQTGRKDCCISIHIHSSWLDWLTICHNKMMKVFQITTSPPKIGKDGYCIWNISHNIIVNGLKDFTVKNNLLVLKRKWNKIQFGKTFSKV